MAVTQNSYVGDGSTRNFTFTFPYLSTSHIKASVAGTQTTAFTLTGASTLQFTTAPSNGAAVLIYRETPTDALLADYTAGTALRESDLEVSLKQILYVSQETQNLAQTQTTGGLQAQIDAVNTKADLALAAPGGYINKIINGDFSVANRAAGGNGTGWLFDRWYADIVGSACTFGRRTSFVLDPIENGLPTTVRQYIRATVTSVSNAANYVRLRQTLENVRTFSGRTVNVAFWARCSSGTPQIAVNLTQRFGTGGSVSADVDTAATKFTLSTTWQRFNVAVNIPSVAGKLIGTNADSSLQLNLWFDAGSNYNTQTNTLGQVSKTVDITQIQITDGATVDTWEERSAGEEQMLCQRFWERVLINHGGYQLANSSIGGFVNLRQQKRRIPTVTLSGSATTTGLDAVTPISISTTGADFLGYTLTKDATSGAFNYNGLYNVDAELI